MADEVRRDIIVALRGEYDPKGIDAGLKHLDQLEARIAQLNSRLTIKLPTVQGGGLGQAVQQMKQVQTGTAEAASNIARGVKASVDTIDAQVERLKKVRTTIATSAKGLTTTTDILKGPAGSGLSARVTRETGASAITVDQEKRRREQERFGRERQKTTSNVTAEGIDDFRARQQQFKKQADADATARLTAENRRRKESARAEQQMDAYISGLKEKAKARDGKIASERLSADIGRIKASQKAEQQMDAYIGQLQERRAKQEKRNNETRAREFADGAKKMQKSQDESIKGLIAQAAANSSRAKQEQTFEQIKARPGFKEVPKEQLGVRVAKDGAIVQDRALINEKTQQLVRLNGETGRVTATTKDLSAITRESGNEFLGAARKVALWTAATGAVFTSIRAIGASVRVFSEVEQGTVALSRVGRGFGKTQEEISAGAVRVTNEILRMKVQFGSVGTEAQEAAVTFARLGLSQKDTILAVRTALLAANVAGIGAADAAGLLAAAMTQFNLSAQDLPGILSKLNTLENNYKVTTLDLLQGISRTGAVFREAGGDIEQLGATIAAVSQSTGRSGAEIGNALKTIASRMGDAAIQGKLFASTGIVIRNVAGDLKPIEQVLGELAVKFQEMSASERVAVSSSIAGVRQRNILQTALDNYLQIQGAVIRQLEDEKGAVGENEQVMSTLAKRINSLVSALEQLGNAIVASLPGTIFKEIVTILTNMTRALAEMPTLAAAGFSILAAVVVGFLVAAILPLRKGFEYLIATILGANIAVTDFARRVAGSTAATVPAIAANAALATSFTAVGVASATSATATAGAAAGVGLLGRGFAALSGPVGAFLAILSVAIPVALNKFGAATKASVDEGLGDKITAAEAAVKKAQDKVRASAEREKTIKNAQAQLTAIDKQEGESGKTNETQERRAKIHRDLINIFGAEAAEIGKVAAADLKASNLSILLAKQRETALEREGELRQKLITSAGVSGSKVVALAEKEAALKAELKRLDQERTRLSSGFPGKTGAAATVVASITEAIQAAEKELAETQRNLSDARDQSDKKIKAVNDVVNPAPAFDNKPAANIDEVKDEIKEIENETKRKFILRLELADSPVEKLQAELDQIEATITGLSGQFAALDPKDTEARTEVQNAIKDKRGEAQDTKAQLEAAKRIQQVERDRKRITGDFERQQKIQEKVLELSVAEADESRRGVLLAELKLALEQRNMEALRQRQSQLQQEAKGLDPKSKAGQDNLVQQQEIRKRLEEGDENIRNRAVDITLARLEAEKKITEEKKKQLEQTSKEIAALSDADLAQVRVLAGKVQRGEQKPLTSEQLLQAPKEFRDLFSKFDKLFPGLGFLPKTGLGFGENAFGPAPDQESFLNRSAAQRRDILSQDQLLGPGKKRLSGTQIPQLDLGLGAGALTTGTANQGTDIQVISEALRQAIVAGFGERNAQVGGTTTNLPGNGKSEAPTPIGIHVEGMGEPLQRLGDSIVTNISASVRRELDAFSARLDEFDQRIKPKAPTMVPVRR